MKTYHLRDIRISRGITQKEVSGHLHVSRQTISRWENGITSPTDSDIGCLAKLYSIDKDVLINAIKKDGEIRLKDRDVGDCDEIARQIEDMHLTITNETQASLEKQDSYYKEQLKKQGEQLKRQEELVALLKDSKKSRNREYTRIFVLMMIAIIVLAVILFAYILITNYRSHRPEYGVSVQAIEIEEEIK